MGRPETPVDQTVPELAELALFLRGLRAQSGLTYAQMAARCQVPAATLKRAAQGRTVPKLDVVLKYVDITTTDDYPNSERFFRRAKRLWAKARFATRPVYATRGYYRWPDPLLIHDLADLSRALRDLHAATGALSPGQLEKKAGGFGILPRSTARRILQGRTVPRDKNQLLGFVTACGVFEPNDWGTWGEAFDRASRAEPRRGVVFIDWRRAA
jgi:transcriptional regulator with XRE-family HTH domain